MTDYCRNCYCQHCRPECHGILEGHRSPLAVAPESGSPSPVARGANPEGDASGVEVDRLKELIRLNNRKANDECKGWDCNEMRSGHRCPNCPLDYVIHV